LEIARIDEGKQIERSDEQAAKVELPRAESLDPGSNVKSERVLQYLKRPLPTSLTDEGMQIERSDEQPSKADSPSFDSLEPDSNVKFESFRQ
jgi:hypothetical protein